MKRDLPVRVLTVAPHFAVNSLSPKPWSQNKTPDSTHKADKDIAILWTGKNTTQWSSTAAATHAVAVCKVETELSADFTYEHAHQ